MSVMRVGSRVSALVGELGYWNGGPQVDANGKKKKRYKERLFGTVVESKSNRNWLVRWDRTGAVNEEEYSTFKLKYEGPGSSLRPTNQEEAQAQEAQQRSQGAVAARRQQEQQGGAVAAATAQVPITTTTTTAQVPTITTTTTTTAQVPMTTTQQGGATTTQVPTSTTTTTTTQVTVEAVLAQAAEEDASARTVDPDAIEEQDDRFDVATDFELYNPDDIEEYKGDRHARKWTNYELNKLTLMDEEVSVGTGARKITWKVRVDITASDVDPASVAEFPDVGVCDFDFTTPCDTTTTTASGWKNPKKKKYRKKKKMRINFLALLIHLWPGKWEEQLERMNNRLETHNQEQMQKKRFAAKRYNKVHEITKKEFWVFWGLMISARIHGRQGQLWDESDEEPDGIEQPVNLGHHMLKYRFRDIKKFVPYMWERPELKETDPWWQLSLMQEEFNKNRRRTVMSSYEKVFDELMSAFRPQTRKNGDLPNLSFIPRKPEPLGAEFKAICCAVTAMMIWIELQRGRDAMRAAEFAATSGVTAACTMRGARDSKRYVGYGDVDEDDPNDPNEVFFGDSWFSSVETTCQLWNRFKCRYGGILKTNHSRFPKAWIEKTMKDWPAGSHIVLEGRATREGVDLIAIGYKYNSRKSLCFICHKDAGSTECTDFYEAKWKDSNGNTESRRVPRPDVMGRYFRVCNRVDMHNHARQSLLALEKHWVTMTGYFRIITSMFGICITDAWKAYRYHLNRQHRHKDMEMKDFASALAHDMLYNAFDSFTSEDRVLVIDSGRAEMQSYMSSLGGSSPNSAADLQSIADFQSIRTASTAGAGAELIAVATREREIAKHGELEHIEGMEKDRSIARGKRKRCSISICSKKSRWQCKACGAALCHGGDCVPNHQSKVRKDMKEKE
jgi:hypothetical protein